jgi:Ca2+-binding EF-hand superfamily protein
MVATVLGGFVRGLPALLTVVPTPFLSFTIYSHPFDKQADKTDDAVKEAILMVGPEKDDHMELMNELVFDDRIEGLSESCIELMRQLMHPDPQKRMTSDKFLRHPWIQGLTASWKTMEKTHDELKAFWQNRFRAEIMTKFAAGIGISGETLSEKDLKKIFHALDLKKNGVLELEEIQTAFRDLGVPDKNIRAIFACADLDGTGVIHFDEFKTLMRRHVGDGPGLQVSYLQRRFKSRILGKFAASKGDTTSDKDKLREVFNAIDLEGNGVLDPHEIRVVLRSAGEPEDVISRIVASLDLNRDGGVSWEEFLEIMSMRDE